jgi:hypothetical protein
MTTPRRSGTKKTSMHLTAELIAVLKPAEEGGFTATFKEFPEVVSEGDDEQEALSNLLDALATYLAWKSWLATN